MTKKEMELKEKELELREKELSRANEPQQVVIANEKPSVGERIKEYGLFAIVWHGIGMVFDALFD